MIHSSKLKKYIKLILPLILLALTGTSCSKDEPEMRTENDILGVWQGEDGRYLNFNSYTIVSNLLVEVQDGETIGHMQQSSYFYEPGYNIVLYMDNTLNPSVYQVVTLSEEEMVWCWVENIKDYYTGPDSIGEIIGQIIRNAQEGYHLDPALYQYFSKVSQDEYDDILEEIDILVPW